jgi:hypothetical protein
MHEIVNDLLRAKEIANIVLGVAVAAGLIIICLGVALVAAWLDQ